MESAKRLARGFLASLLLAAVAAAQAGDIGTAFTLQAQLKQAGQPVNQPADVRASLFDAAAGGNQVGSTIQLDNVNVIDGIVAADLDFGAMAFFGDPRFIELEIRVPHDPNNTAPFTLLNGRLPVRPTPEAIHAQVASSLRAPVVISGDDANGAIVTVENIAPGGAALDVLGNLRVGPQQEFQVDAATGNVATQGAVTSNSLSVAADAFVGGLVDAGEVVTVGDVDVGNDLDVGDDAIINDDLDVGHDATITNNLTVGSNAAIGNDLDVFANTNLNGFLNIGTPTFDRFIVDPTTGFMQTQGDISVLGAYVDSQGSRGQQDQFLSSTGVGTEWRDLIVGPLDLKNNALINIGTGGTSFTPVGDLVLNGDLFVGNPTTLAVDATNGLLTLGANKLVASAADGSLNVGPDLFTVNGATGDVFAQRSVQVAVANFLADDFGLTVGPNFEFRVKPDTGDMAMGTGTNDKLTVEAASGNLSTAGFVEPDGGIRDIDNELGDSGQVLASTGSAVRWIDPPMGGGNGNFSAITVTGNSTLGDGSDDTTTVSGDMTVLGDAHVDGAYFDSTGQPGQANQFLSSTVTGTLWRDLIVAPLDMKNFAITNIGSGGASFSGAGGLNLKGDLDLGTNGITGIGTANSFFFPDGSLTVRPVLTVQDAQGQTTLSSSGSLTSSMVDFVVGPAQFSVDADTGDTLISGSLFVANEFRDSGNFPGAPNQILASTGTGTQWVNPPGSGGSGNFSAITVTGNTGLGDDENDTTTVTGDASFGRDVTIGRNADIQRDLVVAGDSHLNGSVFDSAGLPGEADQFLSSTGTGTLWRDLIIAPLDMKTFAITNIGSGGSSFGGDGSLNVIGNLDVGSGNFTVNGSTGDATAQRNLTANRDLLVSGDSHINGSYFDSPGLPGDPGQILSSTGTGTLWVDPPSGGTNCMCEDFVVTGNTALGDDANDTTTVTGDSTFNGDVGVNGKLTSDNIVTNTAVISSTLSIGAIQDAQASTGTQGQVPTADGSGGWLWMTPQGGGGANPTYDTVHINQIATWGANPQSPTLTLNGTNGTLVTSGAVTAQNGFNAGTNSNTLLGRTAIAHGLSITGSGTGPALNIFAAGTTSPGVILNGPPGGAPLLSVRGDAEVTGTLDANLLTVVTLDGTEVKVAAIRDAQDSTGTQGQIPTADGNGSWLWATPSGGGPNGLFQALTVTGNTALGDDANDTITLTGNSTFNGSVRVVGTLTSDAFVTSTVDTTAFTVLDNTILGNDANDMTTVTGNSAFNGNASVNGTLTSDAIITPTLDATVVRLTGALQDNQSFTGAPGQVLTADGNGGVIWQTPSGGGGPNGQFDTLSVSDNTILGNDANDTTIINGSVTVENNGSPIAAINNSSISYTVPLDAQGSFNAIRNIVTDIIQVSPPTNPFSPVVQVTATSDFAPMARFFNFQGTAPAIQVVGNSEFQGNAVVDGDLTVNGVFSNPSDARLKRNVEPIRDALEIVARMRGVRFDWDRAAFPDRRFDDRRHVGFIAQELKDALPEVVNEDADGFHSVDYSKITAVLAEAVKELDGRLSRQERALREDLARVQSAVDASDAATRNGNVVTDGDGFATVALPERFESLHGDYRYQLTVVGTFAQAIVAREISEGTFVIQTDRPNVKVSWQVTGSLRSPGLQAGLPALKGGAQRQHVRSEQQLR